MPSGAAPSGIRGSHLGPPQTCERPVDGRERGGVILHHIDRGSQADGIAGVISFVLQLPLPELGSGSVPGELGQARDQSIQEEAKSLF